MLVVILKADGTFVEEDWPLPIATGRLAGHNRRLIDQRMKNVVGGYAEYVRVLDYSRQYITMVVNETGVRDGLPRNQAATDLYFNNVRTAFPGAEKPAEVADREFSMMVLAKMNWRPDARVRLGPPPDEIYIAGDVILFPFTLEQRDEVLGYAGGGL